MDASVYRTSAPNMSGQSVPARPLRLGRRDAVLATIAAVSGPSGPLDADDLISTGEADIAYPHPPIPEHTTYRKSYVSAPRQGRPTMGNVTSDGQHFQQPGSVVDIGWPQHVLQLIATCPTRLHPYTHSALFVVPSRSGFTLMKRILVHLDSNTSVTR